MLTIITMPVPDTPWTRSTPNIQKQEHIAPAL